MLVWRATVPVCIRACGVPLCGAPVCGAPGFGVPVSHMACWCDSHVPRDGCGCPSTHAPCWCGVPVWRAPLVWRARVPLCMHASGAPGSGAPLSRCACMRPSAHVPSPRAWVQDGCPSTHAGVARQCVARHCPAVHACVWRASFPRLTCPALGASQHPCPMLEWRASVWRATVPLCMRACGVLVSRASHVPHEERPSTHAPCWSGVTVCGVPLSRSACVRVAC
jgi:hypothetical protein